MKRNQDPNWIKDIPLDVVVEVGKTRKDVGEILLWRRGTVINLEDSLVNILRVYVNGRYFAYGDVLKNDDGEMSLRVKKIFLDEEGLKDVQTHPDL